MNAGQPVPPDSLFPPMPMSKRSVGVSDRRED